MKSVMKPDQSPGPSQSEEQGSSAMEAAGKQALPAINPAISGEGPSNPNEAIRAA